MAINIKIDDLDFADDISLFSSTKHQIQDKTTRLDQEPEDTTSIKLR